MKKIFFFVCFICIANQLFCWGFYAHKTINHYAVFLLPPQLMMFYKPNINFITEHAVDPDKRRYAVAEEGARHYIDLDHYGAYPYSELPRSLAAAIDKFGKDTLEQYGIVPWHIQAMLARLTNAFKEKNYSSILKNSTEIGHYIADAHVPLHACENYNGQKTGQQGIHGFWESRIPELLAAREFDFFIGKAAYLRDPATFIWQRVLESANAADSVLKFEKQLSVQFRGDQKVAFEERNNKTVQQYSSAYTIAYNNMLNGMVERRMRQSVFAVASFWFTAWVNAGQPDLSSIVHQSFSENDLKEFEKLNEEWKSSKAVKGREHSE